MRPSGMSWQLAARVAIAGVAFLFIPSHPAGAQATDARLRVGDPVATAVSMAAATAVTAEHPARVVFANRVIVEFRATVLSRTPSARATAAVDLIGRLAEKMSAPQVAIRTYDQAIVVTVGDQPALVIYQADVDPLEGETLPAKADAALAQLRLAFDETGEFRDPARLARAAVLVLAVTAAYVSSLWLVIGIDRRMATRLAGSAERRLRRLPGGEALLRVADARSTVHRFFTIVSAVVAFVLTYTWLAIVLRRIPYTRPWGETLRGSLVSTLASAARSCVDALPDLFKVLVIVTLVRFLARLATMMFVAVEQGRLTLPWVHPDTAPPTRRIVVALLWLCGLVVSYPYLPGSQSEVFKGVSVFVGLIVSFGSSGVMNQVMSGLTLTYSRALKRGDYVRVANIEGTVTALGTLATKVMTPRNEEITIPNAIMLSDAATNYSRNADLGVFAPTSVTIGYDTPWRQVHALLLLAAARTEGVRNDPKPVILQTSLQDFYVQYTLFVALEHPDRRIFVLDTLHRHIQDAFNEYGVQIMSPMYIGDPAGPKVVPPSLWHAAPAPPQDGRPPQAVGMAVDGVRATR